MHAHIPPFTNRGRKLYDETTATAAAQDAKLDMTDAKREAKLRTVAHYIYHAKLLMDEVFAESKAHSRELLADIAREAQTMGLYDDGIPAESAYIASFSPNGSRIATADEVDNLRDFLTAERLREYGIGDVLPADHPWKHITLHGPESHL